MHQHSAHGRGSAAAASLAREFNLLIITVWLSSKVHWEQLPCARNDF
jgi:hypothetical protein